MSWFTRSPRQVARPAAEHRAALRNPRTPSPAPGFSLGHRLAGGLRLATLPVLFALCGIAGAQTATLAPQWGLLTPAANPSARDTAALAYDAATGTVVLFGGENSSALSDTWTWDGTNWTHQSPAHSPSARYGASMVYDAGTGNIVLFGGYGAGYLNETWTWNGTDWTQQSPAHSPSARYGASMTYDAGTGNVVLFGGTNGPNLGDTWTWDGTDWTQQSPGNSPSGRYSASLVYDTATGNAVLFGGYRSTNLSDTWTWDGTNWTPLSPASSPSARYGASMIYAPALGSVVLFGGDGTGLDGDTWTWSGTNWTLQSGTNPPARYAASMDYDVATGNAVLFGGSGAGEFSDTRIYGTQTNFGSIAVASNTTQTLTFSFGTGGTIAAPAVLTQGAAGLDFTDTANGTCTTNGTSHTYNSGDTCTVIVTFAPTHPGLRLGAVQLTSGGSIVATAPIYGIGTGPQVIFTSNATPSTVGNGFSYPTSSAVDGSGDVFVADYFHDAVKEIVAVSGQVSSSSTVNTIATFSGPVAGVAVDGSGDVFAAVTGSGNVSEIVAVNGQVSGTSTVNTISSSFTQPFGVAVDGSGDVFVSDENSDTVSEVVAVNGQVSSSSTVNIIHSGFNAPSGIAVDAAGDVFVADANNNAVREIVASGGQVSSGSTVITVGSGFSGPAGVAVDSSGNVFVADSIDHKVQMIEAVNGQVSSSSTVLPIYSGSAAIYGVALDSSGDLFVGNSGNNIVQEFPFATPPTLTFPTSTSVGSADSADGALPVTVANDGNATLSFSVPGSGLNPSVSTNFLWDGTSTCQQTASGGSAYTLAASALCSFSIDFEPQAAGSIGGQVVLSDNSLNASPAMQTISLNGTAVATAPGAPTIGVAPAGDTQATVNFTAPTSNGGATITGYTATSNPGSLTGTCSASPCTVTGLTNGQAYTFTVTATNSIGTGAASAASNQVTPQASQTITFNNPGTQAYATAPTLTATASSGLSVAFTSATTGVCTITSGGTLTFVTVGSCTIDANQAGNAAFQPATQVAQTFTVQGTPTVTWSTPSPIVYGTALSSTQLDATATFKGNPVAGTFNYTPAAGTVLGAGTQTLNVTFTPTDTTDFTNASGSAQLTVNQATVAINWAAPSSIVYGTALSGTQLDATATYNGNPVPGTFVYTPAAGMVLTAATHTLSVTFTPTDTTDYAGGTQTVQLTVNQATPTINWATPSSTVYGTALSGTQLDATATYNGNPVPGAFVYTPAAGTMPTVGTQTLSVTFTPTDATDYAGGTQTVQLTVNQATPAINWATPSPIVYSTALSAAQLNATAIYNGNPVAGTLVYTPAAGTVLTAANHTLSVTFTPTDSTDFTPATQTVQLTVNQAATVIGWAAPSPIAYGTALSGAQFGATASFNGNPVSGTFVYTPAAGAMLTAGTHTLGVTFTPADATDYTTVSASVQLTVTQDATAIAWATPSSIVYGTALSGNQLNATASYNGNPVPGTFVYTPAAGTVPQSGNHTLSVTFTPTDTTDYAAPTATASLSVTNAALTITANSATRIYGAANPTFAGTVNGAVNGDTFTESFSTTATAASPVGTYSIVPSATGADLADYTQTAVNGTLAITQAATATTIGLSGAIIAPNQNETITATVASSTTGTPTGTVSFYDGGALLGTVAVVGGAASYSTTSLVLGAHVISATYSGDGNFTGGNSIATPTITVAPLNFTIAMSSPTIPQVIPGQTITYQVTVAPTVYGIYPGEVSFAVSGLPPGATVSLSQPTVAATAGPQTFGVTIITAPATAADRVPSAPSESRRAAPFALAFLALLGIGAVRKRSRALRRLLGLVLLLAGGVAAAGVSGCGGTGFFAQASQTYTVTVTATASGIQHTASFTLEVQ